MDNASKSSKTKKPDLEERVKVLEELVAKLVIEIIPKVKNEPLPESIRTDDET